MGIDLKWEDEKGNSLGEVGDPKNRLSYLVTSGKLNGICLKFLDAYGNTAFNQLQIPLVISELESAREREIQLETRTHLDLVLDLARKSKDQVHTYLKFYGD